MRVPDEVRDCVVFIGVQETGDDGQLVIRWGGTGFFVSVPSIGSPPVKYIYLVTAMHVVYAVQSRGFIIRANKQDGGAENIHVPPNAATWWYHPSDANADVALVAFGLPNEQFLYRSVPTSMFMTEEIVRQGTLGLGDEVYLSGLFRNLTGTKRNLPIVRIGNVAMMPDERVPTEWGPMNAYLIEARSLGGLSGSPVFIHSFASEQIYLFGLMHGHWKLPVNYQTMDAEIRAREDFGDEGQMVNMGIAIVVPAIDILTTLNQPELTEARRQQDEVWQRRNLPVMDSD